MKIYMCVYVFLFICTVCMYVYRKRLQKKHDYKEVEQNVDLVPVASTYGKYSITCGVSAGFTCV